MRPLRLASLLALVVALGLLVCPAAFAAISTGDGGWL